MKRSNAIAVLAMLFLAGCGAGTAHSISTSGRVVQTPEARAIPYQLYTHCGIEWARIKGTFWRAQRPLSDGNGNPPAGWGNPFQHGTLTFMNAKTARFASAAGTVIFDRTDRARPPFICS